MKLTGKIKEALKKTASEALFVGGTLIIFSATLWLISAQLPSTSPLAGRGFVEIILTLGGTGIAAMFLRTLLFRERECCQEVYEVTFILPPATDEAPKD
ncbi:MAG: hypothetical protein Q4A37_03505 [Candidatus Saccharibacteria bacterium]|nr:hypothetical protein [Candidatus Saccharibacteria bacterium]